MDMLQLIGLLSSLNPTFLGLTFLAFGNSLAGKDDVGFFVSVFRLF